MLKDSKNIAIIVLVVALVVTTSLWIHERNKPSAVAAFSEKLTKNQADLKADCADTATQEGRNKCNDALEKTKNILGDFYDAK